MRLAALQQDLTLANGTIDSLNFTIESTNLLIDEMLWPDHPLGRDIGGTKDSVMAMTRETVLGHLEQYYSLANMVVSVAGNVDHDEVVEQGLSIIADEVRKAYAGS